MWKGSGIAGEWTASYESDPAVIYALDRDFRLTHCNLAWDRFALENGGDRATREHQLGRNLLDAMPNELAGFYRRKYREVLETHREQTHVMECSSPRLRRRFHMSIRPFGDSGLLIVDSLLDESPHGDESLDDDSSYVDSGGIVIMCAHCRRTRNLGKKDRWDWVPRYLSAELQVSHGLCPVCVNYHYGLAIP